MEIMGPLVIILTAVLVMAPGISVAQMHGGTMHGGGQHMMGGQGMSQGGMQNMDMMNQMMGEMHQIGKDSEGFASFCVITDKNSRGGFKTRPYLNQCSTAR